MTRLHLVDYLAAKVNCFYVSDLHYLDCIQKRKLVHVTEKLSPQEFPIREWNDALSYLVNSPAEKTQVEAKQRLLECLQQSTNGI